MTETAQVSFNWISILTAGGPVGITVIIILLLLSLITWAVIIERWRTLRTLYKQSEDFLYIFWEAKSLSDLYARVRDLPYSPAREVFRAGYDEMVRILKTQEKKAPDTPIKLDTLHRALRKARHVEEHVLSKNMSILAIAASACPFIGLFGTVVGIIRAFHSIGQSGATSLAAVAPGISEALAATALGLFPAIPAVIFYNIFSAQARKILLLIDGFSTDLLNILERHFQANT